MNLQDRFELEALHSIRPRSLAELKTNPMHSSPWIRYDAKVMVGRPENSKRQEIYKAAAALATDSSRILDISVESPQDLLDPETSNQIVRGLHKVSRLNTEYSYHDLTPAVAQEILAEFALPQAILDGYQHEELLAEASTFPVPPFVDQN